MELSYPPLEEFNSSPPVVSMATVAGTPRFAAPGAPGAGLGSAGGTVSFLPELIRYAGHEGGSLAPSKEIKFTYETRPDPLSGCRAGFRQDLLKRLSSVEIRSDGALIRRYQLNYSSNGIGFSLLSSIQVFGLDGSSLPSTNFSYGALKNSFSPPILWPAPGDHQQEPGLTFDALFDINGDGLPDHVKKFVTTVDHYLVHLNTGGGFSPPIQWPAPGDNGTAPAGSFDSMLDINGDGLPDHVKKTRDMLGYFIVHMNNGTGFSAAVQWPAPGDNWDPGEVDHSVGSSHGILDMNGDGLPDRVEKKGSMTGYFKVRLNTGTGFAPVAQWPAPGDNWDLGSERTNGIKVIGMLDINGDGLPDHVEKRSEMVDYFNVHLNTGNGFAPVIQWPSPGNDSDLGVRLFESIHGKISSVMLDINGDGLPDQVRLMPYGVTTPLLVRLNTGSGFTQDPSPYDTWDVVGTQWKGMLEYGGPNQLYYKALVDINGDGLVDNVEVHEQKPGNYSVWLNESFGTDLLGTISNPMGGITKITYSPRPTGVIKSASPITVVKEISTSDGMGRTVMQRYAFSGGLYDGTPWDHREFLGFRTATITDNLGNRSVTTFRQNEGAVNNVNFFKGQIEKVETFDVSNNLLTRTENTFGYYQKWAGSYIVPSSFGTYYFPYIHRRDYYEFDPGGSKHTAVEFGYDDFGNVIRRHNLGDVSNPSDDTTILTDYAYNKETYLVNFPVQSRLQDSNGNTLQQSWTFYDGSADWTTPPTKGNPTKSQSWLSGNSDPVITRTYDIYGNMTDQYDSLWNASNGTQGNHIKTAFDGVFHQYPIGTTNSLNQTETFNYNFSTGEMLSRTDANGLTTRLVYDTFGRVTKEIGPGDSETYPTVSNEYNIFQSPPHLIVRKQRIEHHEEARPESDRTLDTYTYIDGLGRSRQTKGPGEQGKQLATGWVEFNDRGLPEKTYAAITVEFSTSMAVVGASVPHSTINYDAQGRMVKVINADGTSAERLYSGWENTLLDENNHKKDFIKDAYGNITGVREHLDGSQNLTTYRYDAPGNLLEITKTNGEKVSIAYDSLRRKLSMKDPQMGNWGYEYDGNGNLIKQTDAKGQVITLEYDRLGRLVSKTYPDGKVVRYDYDTGPNAQGRLSKVTDLTGTQHFSYDALGRLTEKKRTLDGKVYVTATGYDLLGRDTSLTYPDSSEVRTHYEGSFLKSIESGGGALYAMMNYDPIVAGQLKTMTMGNGIVTDYKYQMDNQRLLGMVTKSSTQTLQDIGYAYEPAGNIRQVVDANRGTTRNYLYDDLYRLKEAKGEYGNQLYKYDSVGNLLGYLDYMDWDGVENKPKATASSSWGAGAEPWRALDGNGHTRWTALPYDRNEWLMVDLGHATDFKEVVLSWEAAYAKIYRLKCSLDGKTWITMKDAYYSDGGMDIIPVGQRTARYVKMEVITRFNPKWGSSLWEFRVSDGRTAWASSNGWGAKAVMDGSPNTRWASIERDPQYVGIYFGEEKVFNTVRLLWEAAYGKVYEIQTSSDAAHWKVIHRENNGDGNVDEIFVGDQRAKFLRVYGLERGTQWGYSLWEVEVFQSNDQNAALKRKSTASSGESSTGYAVDGSTGTGWVSSPTDNQWWQTDFIEPRLMNRVKMQWGDTWGETYRLQASIDGLNWKTIYKTVTGAGGEDTATFPSIRARYIRLEGIKRSGAGGYDLREFEVYGPVVKAWASSEGSSMPAAHAVDANSQTRWSGQATDPQWLVVDFGETRSFDKVRLDWETAYGKSYLIEVSTDNANWSIVGSETNGDGGIDEVDVGDQEARYLKIYGLRRGTSWGYSLYEVSAYKQDPPLAEPLIGSFPEGVAPAGLDMMTDIPSIQAAIQVHKGKILKDANGNMVIARDKWIAYDYDNRPRQVVTEDGSLTEFTYDYAGDRVSQKVYAPGSSNPTVSTYIGTIYEEKGTERIKYIYAGSKRVAQISSTEGIRYFTSDHLGSSSIVTDGVGAQVQSMSYLPFGGTYQASESNATSWRYTGQRQDDSTGLYYYNARYYDPVLGKFLTPDTIVQSPYDPQFLNRYTYCRNNPINMVDPSGHEAEEDYYGLELELIDSGTRQQPPTLNDERSRDPYGYNQRQSDYSNWLQMYNWSNRLENERKRKEKALEQEKENTAAYGKLLKDFYDDRAEAAILGLGHGALVGGGNAFSSVVTAGRAGYPDITNELNALMMDNAKVLQARVEAFGWISGAKWWVGQVKTGGNWDYKQDVFSYRRSFTYRYNGQDIPYDGPGNINFGYTGKVLGFPLSALQSGAGFAQVLSGTAYLHDFHSYFDDPFDQSFIGLGFNINIKQ